MSMDTEDPFAAVEPDPLTGTTPDEPPVPTSDELPPGVEAGMLGGTDTPAPDPDAEPEPVEHPDTDPPGFADPEAEAQAGEEAKDDMLAAGQPDAEEAPSESPDPPHEESGAEDGTPLPPEPETAVEPPAAATEGGTPFDQATAAGEPAPPTKAAAKQGGAPSRSYFIFEEIEIELGGKVTFAYVKREFGNEDTIVARNGPNALKAAGRAIGDGYEGTLAPVPVSMWNPKPVSTKQKDNLSVSVG